MLNNDDVTRLKITNGNFMLKLYALDYSFQKQVPWALLFYRSILQEIIKVVLKANDLDVYRKVQLGRLYMAASQAENPQQVAKAFLDRFGPENQAPPSVPQMQEEAMERLGPVLHGYAEPKFTLLKNLLSRSTPGIVEAVDGLEQSVKRIWVKKSTAIFTTPVVMYALGYFLLLGTSAKGECVPADVFVVHLVGIVAGAAVRDMLEENPVNPMLREVLDAILCCALVVGLQYIFSPTFSTEDSSMNFILQRDTGYYSGATAGFFLNKAAMEIITHSATSNGLYDLSKTWKTVCILAAGVFAHQTGQFDNIPFFMGENRQADLLQLAKMLILDTSTRVQRMGGVEKAVPTVTALVVSMGLLRKWYNGEPPPQQQAVPGALGQNLAVQGAGAVNRADDAMYEGIKAFIYRICMALALANALGEVEERLPGLPAFVSPFGTAAASALPPPPPAPAPPPLPERELTTLYSGSATRETRCLLGDFVYQLRGQLGGSDDQRLRSLTLHRKAAGLNDGMRFAIKEMRNFNYGKYEDLRDLTIKRITEMVNGPNCAAFKKELCDASDNSSFYILYGISVEGSAFTDILELIVKSQSKELRTLLANRLEPFQRICDKPTEALDWWRIAEFTPYAVLVALCVVWTAYLRHSPTYTRQVIESAVEWQWIEIVERVNHVVLRWKAHEERNDHSPTPEFLQDAVVDDVVRQDADGSSFWKYDGGIGCYLRQSEVNLFNRTRVPILAVGDNDALHIAFEISINHNLTCNRTLSDDQEKMLLGYRMILKRHVLSFREASFLISLVYEHLGGYKWVSRMDNSLIGLSLARGEKVLQMVDDKKPKQQKQAPSAPEKTWVQMLEDGFVWIKNVSLYPNFMKLWEKLDAFKYKELTLGFLLGLVPLIDGAERELRFAPGAFYRVILQVVSALVSLLGTICSAVVQMQTLPPVGLFLLFERFSPINRLWAELAESAVLVPHSATEVEAKRDRANWRARKVLAGFMTATTVMPFAPEIFMSVDTFEFAVVMMGVEYTGLALAALYLRLALQALQFGDKADERLQELRRIWAPAQVVPPALDAQLARRARIDANLARLGVRPNPLHR